MWLTGHRIIQAVLNSEIRIEPFHFQNVNPNSYNYTLFPIIKKLKSDTIDLKHQDHFEEIHLGVDGVVLYPGECYLGCTNEIFHSDVFASLVTGRSSIGRKFITNHITAGLVDQGFNGRITLEITVTKPTRVYPNIPFGQIYWYQTLGEPYLYKGKYQKQNDPKISAISKDFIESVKHKKLFIIPEFNSPGINFENSFYCSRDLPVTSSLIMTEDYLEKLAQILQDPLIDRVEITGGGDPVKYSYICELISFVVCFEKRVKLYTKLGNNVTNLPFIDEINVVISLGETVDSFKIREELEKYKRMAKRVRLCIPMEPLTTGRKSVQERIACELSPYCDEIVFRPLSGYFTSVSVSSLSKYENIFHPKVKFDLIEFNNATNKPLLIKHDGSIDDDITQ